MQVNRLFTSEGQSPYASIKFAARSSKISKLDGSVVFEMAAVNVPEQWDQTAVDVLAQKYLRHHSVNRGASNTLQQSAFSCKWAATDSFQLQIAAEEDREIDSREAFHRMVGCWTSWGMKLGYFTTDADAQAFYDELSYMIAAQIFAPNSPQWFNTGVSWAYGYTGRAQGHWHVEPITGVLELSPDSYTYPASSACFIQSIDDNLVEEGGIMDTWVREARIFKYGGGSGINFSNLRAKSESLSTQGVSSGVMSFLKVGDVAAGSIKSGGISRRAAKLVVLDADHPDIFDFVGWKVKEEHKVIALAAGSKQMIQAWKDLIAVKDNVAETKKVLKRAKKAGVPMLFLNQCLQRLAQGDVEMNLQDFDLTWDHEGYHTVSAMNANNSVRVTDAFMEAVLADSDWELRGRVDTNFTKKVKAKELFHAISRAAWFCADPGLQFHDTINNWHTGASSAPIRAANPCLTGDTLIAVADGRNAVPIKDLVGTTTNVYAWDRENNKTVIAPMHNICVTRSNADVLKVTLDDGSYFKATANHLIMLKGGAYRKVENLQPGDSLTPYHSKLSRRTNGTAYRRYVWSGKSWRAQYRFIWENESGKTPRGHHIHHRDWNSTNDSFINLELLLAEEHTALHREKMLGDKNPMHRRDVVAKAIASLKARYENGYTNPRSGVEVTTETRNRMRAKWTDPRRAAAAESMRERLHAGVTVPCGRPQTRAVYQYDCAVCGTCFTTYYKNQHCCSRDCSFKDTSRNVKISTALQDRTQPAARVLKIKETMARFAVNSPKHGLNGSAASTKNKCLKAARALMDAGYDVSFASWEKLRSVVKSLGIYHAPHLATVSSLFSETELREAAALYNHKVVSVEPCGFEDVYDGTVDGFHNFAIVTSGSAVTSNSGIFVHNCAEYNYIDNSACNLASINLVSMMKEDGTFDVDTYTHACRLVTLALEITVAMSQYPTKEIAWNSFAHRTLGVGYANLGSLLMRSGIPYDSVAGRAYAAGLTAIMTAVSYKTSAEIAAELDPCLAYDANKDDVARVIRNHRNAAYGISVEQLERLNTRVAVQGLTAANFNGRFGYILNSARRLWDEAAEMVASHGLRNMQTTLLAPTGCVVPETLVITGSGIKRIARMGAASGEQWQDIDVTVATPDGPQQATKFFVNGIKPTLRVVTKHGYDVQATPNHQLKIINKVTGEWEWRRLDAINPGDVIPVTMQSLIGSARVVTLAPLQELYRSANKMTTTPAFMTPVLAELIGYFMGDGSLHEKGLRFAVAKEDVDVRDHVVSNLNNLFGVEPKVEEQDGYWNVYINSVPVASWWIENGFSKDKPSADHVGKGFSALVPDAILESNNSEIYAAFLRGVFEADGSASAGGFVASKDAQFLSDLRVIGSVFNLAFKNRACQSGFGGVVYQMRLADSTSTQSFCDHVGFIGLRKNTILQAYADKYFKSMKHDRRRVFVGSERIQSLTPFVDDSTKRFLWSCVTDGHIPHRVATVLSNVPGCEWLRSRLNYFYTKVMSVEDGGERETYDLSVPENVTYTANGFVSHNTIGLVMSCDTTGVEPDFALVKFKKLAGGGYFKLVNGAVPAALKTLGYKDSEIEDIIDYVFGEPIMKGHTDGIRKSELIAAGYAEETLQKWDDDMKASFDPSYVLPMDELIAKFGSERVEKFVLDVGGRGTVEGSPRIKAEHLAVFDCAAKCGKYGSRLIKPEGHLRMMAEIQPFLSGAISKTINMSADATVEDIEKTYMQAWSMGLKAVAVYRDGSKMSQPLSTSMAMLDGLDDALEDEETNPAQKVDALATGIVRSLRAKLPHRRGGYTQAARISNSKLYLRTGEYLDGTLGEIFLDTHKEGATFRSLLNNFAIAISIGLQYGVPLEEFCDAFIFTKFEPYGGVQGHDYVKRCTSMLDFIFRDLAITYLGRNDLAHVSPEEVESPAPAPSSAHIELVPMPTSLPVRQARTEMEVAKERGFTGDMCPDCGHFKMVRNGVCLKCTECGATTGCS